MAVINPSVAYPSVCKSFLQKNFYIVVSTITNLVIVDYFSAVNISTQ